MYVVKHSAFDEPEKFIRFYLSINRVPGFQHDFEKMGSIKTAGNTESYH